MSLVCPTFSLLALGGILGVVLGTLIARHVRTAGVAVALGLMGIGIFVWLVFRMPVRGVLSEVAVWIVGVIATAPATLLIWKFPEKSGGVKFNFDKALRGALGMALMFAVLIPFFFRELYALQVGWSCDGPIVEKYLSSNHAEPTLVVRRADGGKTTLEAVDRALYFKAQVYDRLTKQSGETWGLLNGQRVEVVRPSRFWHP